MADPGSRAADLTATAVPAAEVPECNFLRLLANSPAALAAYLGSCQALARGQLTRRQRELLALAVAEINGARYCLSAHCAAALAIGLTETEIRAARRASAADPHTHALLRFAQVITLQRGEIGDADFHSARRAGLSDGQIAEVIAHVALNVFTNYFNAVGKTDLDFPLPKPGAESLA